MSKATTLRASQHSGREGSGRHNDRSFLTGRSAGWIREHAAHIDTSRTSENQVYTWDGQTDIERSERAWYDRTYGKGQEKTNSRYIREGHKDRCKTTDDLYNGKLTRPEEMILQVGNRDVRVDDQKFLRAVNDYISRLLEWNKAHGGHMTILSMALHMDETTPHVHIRRVWDYQDRDGLTRLGQNKALEQAGVELPDPSKPVGRYNNRKMTFDREARAMWHEACRAHGLEIETEPVPDRRHQDKADYIRSQLNRGIEKDRQRALQASQEVQGLRIERDRLAEDFKNLLSEKDKLQSELDEMTITRTMGDLPENDRFDKIEAEAKPTLLDKSKVTISMDNLQFLLTWARSAWRDRKVKDKVSQELTIAQSRAREASKARSLGSVKEQIDSVKAKDALTRYQDMERAFPDEFKKMDEFLDRKTRAQEREVDRGYTFTR